MDYELKSGDTTPFGSTLTDARGPAPIANAQVFFKMKLIGGNVVVSGTGSVLDAAAGKVVYQWKTGETDVPGVYRAEWFIIFSDGSKGHFPSDGYTLVYIRPSL